MTDRLYETGFTVGVFDLFHAGHVRFLDACRKRCRRLIVGICDDDYVRTDKHRDPVYPEEQRRLIVSALRGVDSVVVVSRDEVLDKRILADRYLFDVLFSGDDWQGTERYKIAEKQLSEFGISVVYLPYSSGVSTSDTIRRIHHAGAQYLAERSRA